MGVCGVGPTWSQGPSGEAAVVGCSQRQADAVVEAEALLALQMQGGALSQGRAGGLILQMEGFLGATQPRDLVSFQDACAVGPPAPTGCLCLRGLERAHAGAEETVPRRPPRAVGSPAGLGTARHTPCGCTPSERGVRANPSGFSECLLVVPSLLIKETEAGLGCVLEQDCSLACRRIQCPHGLLLFPESESEPKEL